MGEFVGRGIWHWASLVALAIRLVICSRPYETAESRPIYRGVSLLTTLACSEIAPDYDHFDFAWYFGLGFVAEK
jgi:hypothetical protein